MTGPRDKSLPGTERSFGFSVGGVLCLIAAALFWRGRPMRAEVVGAIGGALVLLGAIAPSLLTRPRVWWWRGARVVGDFNARVLLSAMFFLVFLPLGIVWRLTGKDPLARARRSGGWSPYPARYRDRQHFSRMF
jgi:saxitoxin biosynthesis operon SxtJ-like protein